MQCLYLSRNAHNELNAPEFQTQCQKRLQIVEAFRKVQNEQKRARIPNTMI